jgi:hypothetical protein
MKTFAFFPVILLSIIVLVFFSGCSKDEDPLPEPGNKTPSVELTLSKESNTVWNTIELLVKATDEDGEISLIEIFANDQKIGESSSAEQTFEWNTREMVDGPVVLKAVATDDEGEATQVEYPVEVLNTLLNFSIPEGYLIDTYDLKYYAYITNELRQVIWFTQIEEEPWQGVAMRPENFDDATFDLHFIAANPLKADLITYTSVSPGDFKPLVESGNGNFVKWSDVTFYDVPEHKFYQFASHAGEGLQADKVYKAPVYENLDFAYLYLKLGDNGIYTFANNLENAHPEISLQTTPFEMTRKEFSIPSPSTSFSFVAKGHIGASYYSPSVNLFTDFSSNVNDQYENFYHIPTNEPIFKNFSSEMAVMENERFYINQQFNSLGTTFEKRTTNFTLDGLQLNSINIGLSGQSFDNMVAYYVINSPQIKFTWECHSATPSIEFPPIPGQVTAVFSNVVSSNIVFQNAKVRIDAEEYDHFDGFDEYWNRISGRSKMMLLEGAEKKITTGEIF